MALLGGPAQLLGPLAGVIPLTALFEVLSARFPNYFSILLGVTFLVIVYLVPNGVIDRVRGLLMRRPVKHKQETKP
jgi:branched-chain amino acid transport system permease protein